MALVGVAALIFDQTLHDHAVGIGAALYVLLLAAVVATPSVTANPQSRGLALSAVVFGSCFVFRDSPWLAPFNFLAAGGCLVAAASIARSGSVLDISAPKAVLRSIHAAVNGALGLGFLARGRSTRLAPVVRGVAIALPLAIVIGALLAAGDAVFAAAFEFETGDLFPHVVLIIVGAWIAAGLARVARTPTMETSPVRTPSLGPTEWTIVLGTLNVLYAGFVAARVIAATEGGARVLETAGLTYAEYARSGFFELLGAAAVTLGALLVLRATADMSSAAARLRFVALGASAVLLTLVVVMFAFQRLVLYERAFGLSMLRLYSMVFCVWLAVALVALGLWIAGFGESRPWFWSASAATALILLLALNIANPEAVVVRHNAARVDTAAGFDEQYATELSADAIPTLTEVVGALESDDESFARERLCSSTPGDDGWAGWNLARSRARRALDAFCNGAGFEGQGT